MKELYEKPKLETISLVDIDIITSSAGEGGDVPVENDNDNSSNSANLNEIDPSPWTKNDSSESHGFFDRFWNIFDDYASQGDAQDNTPVDNGIQETPSEEVPAEENIPEDVPTDNNNE